MSVAPKSKWVNSKKQIFGGRKEKDLGREFQHDMQPVSRGISLLDEVLDGARCTLLECDYRRARRPVADPADNRQQGLQCALDCCLAIADCYLAIADWCVLAGVVA